MKKIVGVLGLVCILMGLPVAAVAERGPVEQGWVWDQKRVLIQDYTSEVYEAEILDTIADFNEILPKYAPRLIYQRMPVMTCPQLLNNPRGIFGEDDMDDIILRGITVCEDDLPEQVLGMVIGVTWWEGERGVFEKVMVGFDPIAPLFPSTVCHEFMHAITGIDDNYGAVPGKSCVWGELSDPGPFDVKFMRKVYRDYQHER